ncbi:MAG: hypothetical protein QGI57_02755 [Dehalococcoidales bacterium]|nr:hypothetical protein [Dehalococcoidales bacterium]
MMSSHLTPDLHLLRRQVHLFNTVDQGQLRVSQAGGDTRSHLSRIPVNGLLTAEYHRHFFLPVQPPDSLSQDHAGRQGICPTKSPVTQKHCTISTQGHGFSHGGLGVGRAHGDDHHAQSIPVAL